MKSNNREIKELNLSIADQKNKNLLKNRTTQLLIITTLTVVVLALFSPTFLTLENFNAIFSYESMKGIVIIGITLLLVTGNFDLSVASNMALVSVVVSLLLKSDHGIFIAVIGALAVGTAFGAINGLLVSKAKVPSFIATLGTMYITRSIAFVLTEGVAVGKLPQDFLDFGNATWFGLPSTLIIMVIAMAITAMLLKRQKSLVKLFYIGENKAAANMVGIKSDNIVFYMFILNGFLCAVASIFITAKTTAGIATAFNNQEMNLIAACIIGGASLAGGKGSILGSFLGFILLVFVGNAMSLFGLSSYLKGIIFGAILISSLIIDAYINGSVKKINSRE